MNGGAKTFLVAASFAAASCAGSNGVEVRPIADPGAKLRAGIDRLADSRAQLALGNVGLALEGFRKAAREFPNDPEAYAGMAACYDAMGRHDLAQSKYEAALALAPRNPVLLTALAGALERQGKRDAAADVRAEVAQLHAASKALDETGAETDATLTRVVAAQTVTAAVPAATKAPAKVEPSVVAAAEPVRMRSPAPAMVGAIAVAPATPRPVAHTPVALATPDLAAASAGEAVRIRPPTASQVAVSIAPTVTRIAAPAPIAFATQNLQAPAAVEPPRMRSPSLGLVADVSVAPAVARLPTPAPIAFATPNFAQPVPVTSRAAKAPRLQRMSLNEVALLTGEGPVWRPQVVARTPQKLSVRWVPVRSAASRPNIRLLNAARRQGLAAGTRAYLLDRGWRKIEIGDAAQVRERSLVLYPVSRSATGRSLAAQFGFRAVPTNTTDVFIVLLGRDAAAAGLAKSRG
ncbi:MAG TPA: LytR C-terminal domain-containing protein [Sphingomicrobium sp.]|nr:LytR C-terminal domain-containing protein [Sphingomicrobium sp.]